MDDYRQNQVNAVISDLNKKFGHDVQDFSESCRAACYEALRALAYGCTLKNPRSFGGVPMAGLNFAELADTLNVRELLEAANSLKRCNPERNRLFFLLGVLAVIYKRKHTPRELHKRDYTERSYSAAECKKVVTPLSELKNIDI